MVTTSLILVAARMSTTSCRPSTTSCIPSIGLFFSVRNFHCTAFIAARHPSHHHSRQHPGCFIVVPVVEAEETEKPTCKHLRALQANRAPFLIMGFLGRQMTAVTANYLDLGYLPTPMRLRPVNWTKWQNLKRLV